MENKMNGKEIEKNSDNIHKIMELMIPIILECSSRGIQKDMFLSACEHMWDSCPHFDTSEDEQNPDPVMKYLAPICDTIIEFR